MKTKIKKIIKNDSIALLIISILFPIIAMVILRNNFSENDVPFLMKSAVYIIWLIYLLTRKNEGKYIGITAIYIGILMLLGNVFGSSLFEIIFIILAIIYIIHGIIYIIKVTNNDNKKHTLLYVMYLIQLFIFFLLFISKN